MRLKITGGSKTLISHDIEESQYRDIIRCLGYTRRGRGLVYIKSAIRFDTVVDKISTLYGISKEEFARKSQVAPLPCLRGFVVKRLREQGVCLHEIATMLNIKRTNCWLLTKKVNNTPELLEQFKKVFK